MLTMMLEGWLTIHVVSTVPSNLDLESSKILINKIELIYNGVRLVFNPLVER